VALSDRVFALAMRRHARPSSGKTWIAVGVLCAAVAVLLPLYLQQGPRGLIRSIGLPTWLEAPTENDALMFRAHAGLGTLLNWVGAPPLATASEWFKAVSHAHGATEVTAAAAGIAATEPRTSVDQLQTMLCPIVSQGIEGQGWGPRGVQLAALTRAGLACGDESMLFGTIPDDLPIDYSSHPPVTGLYHATWYPTDGVATEPVPEAMWLHNLAHGEIVLLYHCPAGCPSVISQAEELRQSMWPGRNAHGGPARLLVTAYDDMDYPLAVVAWGALLPLDHFDADQIAAFYQDHVDRGIECRNLVC
jgi:Protein of unknown function (DUF3105)